MSVSFCECGKEWKILQLCRVLTGLCAIALLLAVNMGCKSNSKEDPPFVFDGDRLYVVSIETKLEGTSEYLLAGDSMVGLWRFTQFKDADWDNLIGVLKTGESLIVDSEFTMESILPFKVIQSERVDDLFRSTGSRGLLKNYYSEGASSIDKERVYATKILVESGAHLGFDEVFGEFYIQDVSTLASSK